MSNSDNSNFTPDYDKIASHYASIIEGCGEDLSREGLLDTPMRAAKAFGYLTRGYHQFSPRITPSWYWCRTLSFIHCANTICYLFMAWRTWVICQKVRFWVYPK